MTVYTVQSIDEPAMEPLGNLVVGTFTERGRAVDKCVGYIMDRIDLREDLAWSMAHDENHEDAKEFFSESRKDGRTVVKRGCAKKLREFLRECVDGDGCYYVWDGESSWHFDVDENDVEGELWHTVTWGDSDCEDPEFTTPWPETFLSREAAVRGFYRYAVDLMRDRDVEVSEGLWPTMLDAFKRDGRYQVDLDDGCCVSCVLYHDDAKNVKE